MEIELYCTPHTRAMQPGTCRIELPRCGTPCIHRLAEPTGHARESGSTCEYAVSGTT
jgi:hypothetical protein